MGKKLINGLLFLGIAGLLVMYFFTVNELPERIYTPAQREYLLYNSGNSISQNAPIMNFLSLNEMTGVPDIAKVMPISESRVRANLKARYEEQQGVTATVYDLEFQGEYLLAGPAAPAIEVEVVFPFPENLETLRDVRFTVDDTEPEDAIFTTRAISWRTTLKSGETHRVDISYNASGSNSFTYALPRDQRSTIDVVITVAGLSGSSIPRASLSATKSTAANKGETFTWDYTGLIANRDIQLSLPTRLSFAQRIAELQDDFRELARLAPILVALFVACLAGLFFLNGVRVPLEGYLLAGLSLAAFYPLLTFTSGLIGILPAVLVTVAVVSGLLFGFLGIVVGWAKTWRPLGILLLVFAGFFSLGMLTPWQGLLLTSGGLLLLATFMWAYIRRPARAQASSEEPEETAAPEAPAPEPPDRSYCAHCGQVLEDAYAFCPGCGHDARAVRRCDGCDRQQYVPSGADSVYCVNCGNQLL